MLAFVPAVAAALMEDLPQSICNLPPSSGDWSYHIAARLVTHAKGGVLADPACPGRTLLVSDYSLINRFLAEVDPDRKRFGAVGDGTHVDIELRGKVDENRVIAISEVRAYARYDVYDRRWRVNSTEDWIHTKGWQADEQFPFTRSSRTVKSASHRAVIHGSLDDEAVNQLMKLARVVSGSICQFSESAESMVRMQCIRQGPLLSEFRAWVYARDAESWQLVQKSDAAIR